MEGVFCTGASPQLQGEGNCRCFVIKELLFSNKARRMEGLIYLFLIINIFYLQS